MSQIEERVLSIFLREPGEILKHDIKPAEFSNSLNAEILDAMLKLASTGVDIDVFTVADSVKSKDVLSNLFVLQTDVPASVGNIKRYIADIKVNAKRRALISLIENTSAEMGSDESWTPDEIIGRLVTSLSELNHVDTTRVFDGQSMMRETVEYLDHAFDLKSQGKMAGVPSGMGKLDDLLGGFHNSDFIVVGARPAMGKTAWALTCAINAARLGFKVGFVSTEMSVVQVGIRAASIVSGIPAFRMRDSSFTDNDWPLLTAATTQISNLPFYVMDQPACTVSDIAIQARSWEVNGGIDILFIDYLTRLRPEGKYEGRTLAVGDIATGLKTLARNMNIPVVALAQLSRETTKQAGSIPNMANLRDSGVIEQEADQILMLYRPSVYDESAPGDLANIIVEKNRHGDVAMLVMEFKKETMQWSDPSDNYDEYYESH
jgi:replicative DNA helicase